MSFLPVFLDLSAGVVLLVGAGPQATTKLHVLRASGANVKWFLQDASADNAAPFMQHYAGSVEVVSGEPDDADLARTLAIVSAAGDETGERLSKRARAFRVPINVVDRQDLSTFIFPAIIHRGDVTVAIGTGGASPVLARRIRERIEAVLPARVGELAKLMRRYRAAVATASKHLPALSARRFWEDVVDGPIAAAVMAGRTEDAEAALAHAVDRRMPPAVAKAGVVYLVGAGPGDPDMLTLRALQVLQDADIILFDELVTPEIFDRARRDAARIFVGKRQGQPGIGQAEINRRLVYLAKPGNKVVYLKGGNPFAFGHGGEAFDHLREAGIQTFVVPGIACGTAAEAGLPPTLGLETSQLRVVTAGTAVLLTICLQ